MRWFSALAFLRIIRILLHAAQQHPRQFSLTRGKSTGQGENPTMQIIGMVWREIKKLRRPLR